MLYWLIRPSLVFPRLVIVNVCIEMLNAELNRHTTFFGPSLGHPPKLAILATENTIRYIQALKEYANLAMWMTLLLAPGVMGLICPHSYLSVS